MSLYSVLKARLPRSAVQGLVLLGGTTLSQILPALAAPFLTRLYHPADFGTFALIFAIYGVIAPIVCLRYDVAIVLPDSEEEAAHIALASLTSSVLLAFLSLLIPCAIWLLAPGSKAAAYGTLIVAMLPAGLILFGIQTVAQSWCLRIDKFRVQSVALVAQAAVTVAVQLTLGLFLGSNPYNLIAGMQLGLLASVVVLAIALHGHTVAAIKAHFSIHGILEAARSYARFPVYTGPYAFVGQASTRAVLVILAALTNTQVVGQFALAQRVIFLPISTVMAAASRVFYARAARQLNSDRVKHVVRSMLLIGPLVIGPFFVLGYLFAEPAFAAVFGAEWTQAGTFASILVAPSMVRTLTAWLDRVYDIQRRQRFALLIEIGHSGVCLILLYAALQFTRDPAVGLTWYAAASAAFYVIWLLCTLHIAKFDLSMWLEFIVAIVAMTAGLLASEGLLRFLGLSVMTRSIILLIQSIAVVGVGAWIARRAFSGEGELPEVLSPLGLRRDFDLAGRRIGNGRSNPYEP